MRARRLQSLHPWDSATAAALAKNWRLRPSHASLQVQRAQYGRERRLLHRAGKVRRQKNKRVQCMAWHIVGVEPLVSTMCETQARRRAPAVARRVAKPIVPVDLAQLLQALDDSVAPVKGIALPCFRAP